MFYPVWFVSLGPGDPELVTLKAWKALQEADLVFCPATQKVMGETVSRAENILLALGVDQDKIQPFYVPMSGDHSGAAEAYRKAASEIAGQYLRGKKIALTAEGDAGFYSTIDYIRDSIEIENIPAVRIAGVPAFIACGSLAGLVVTRQDEILEVIPGVLSFAELRDRLEERKTLVVMKASRCEEAIKQAIAELKDVDFHYFENVGIQGMEFYSSRKEMISCRSFPYFSLLMIQKKQK